MLFRKFWWKHLLAGDLNDVDFKIDRLFKEGGDNVYGLGVTLEGLDVNPLMYEFVFEHAWENSIPAHQWVANWAQCRGGNVDNHIVKAWKQLYEKIYTSAALCGQAVLMNARPQLEGVEGWNTLPGYDYKNIDLWKIWKELLKAEGVYHSEYHFDVINVGRQVLGNLLLTIVISLPIAIGKKIWKELRCGDSVWTNFCLM